MPIRRVRPTSNGRRTITFLDTSDLTPKRPEKALTEGLRKHGGRNHHGHLTCRHHGGGHRRLYRFVDFQRSDKDGMPAKVVSLEYDPNRNARLHLLQYADGVRRYSIATNGVDVGREVSSGSKAEVKPGNCLALEDIHVGMLVHSVELTPGRGAQMARAAGAACIVTAKEDDYALLTMPSGEMRKVNLKCRAVVGQVGNLDANLVVIGRAGRHRNMGVRPTVRGSAQNPVSHPMGGGEGRRNGGRHPVSKWGVLSKGGNTRRPRKNTNRRIVRGRKRGPRVGR
jgi:large subunit ribosomal protein L2